MRLGKKLMSWDENEIIERNIEDYKEYNSTKTEDEIRDIICNNDTILTEWNSFTEYLEEILQKKNPSMNWKAEVQKFGWRNQDGEKIFHAENAVEFLREILPDTDCTFHIYEYGCGLAIQNYHHDSPTGEWYYIVPELKTYDVEICITSYMTVVHAYDEKEAEKIARSEFYQLDISDISTEKVFVEEQ